MGINYLQLTDTTKYTRLTPKGDECNLLGSEWLPLKTGATWVVVRDIGIPDELHNITLMIVVALDSFRKTNELLGLDFTREVGGCYLTDEADSFKDEYNQLVRDLATFKAKYSTVFQ